MDDLIMEELIDYYINDYTIFEAVLKRDFLEVTGVLTEDGNKNFLKNIWEKIVGFFEKFKQKLNKFIDDFIKAIDEINQLGDMLRLAQYIELYRDHKYRDKLKELEFKGFKMFKVPGEASLKKSISIIDELTFGWTKEEMEKRIQKLPNPKDVKAEIHKKVWEEKEMTKPFAENEMVMDIIMQFIQNRVVLERSIKNIKKDFNRTVDKKKKEAEKMLKEFKKDARTNKNPGFKESDVEPENKGSGSVARIGMKNEAAEEYTMKDSKSMVDKAQTYLKLISATKNSVGATITASLREIHKIYRLSVQLFVAGGKYMMKYYKKDHPNMKNPFMYESEIDVDDMDYINAYVEMCFYPLESNLE